MPLRVYDTLSRQVIPLPQRDPAKASLYCCGPTVYDVPHAGHARAAVAFDVLFRVLQAQGLDVTYVRNITDIDDKILARARANGEPPLDLSRRMTAVYQQDMAALNCLPPSHEPRVSEHVADIHALIGKLIEQGAAYVVERPEGPRDVYFSVRSFPGYGKLSRRRIDELVSGARVEADELKRDPLDFALWKGAPEAEWGWASPWGYGRPGWHIECSAMSEHYLDHGFDLHAGGMDLIFPHHENEIAQSEAAQPQAGPFARAWLHNGFVNVDKEKMSKSLGNFVTVRDVLARNDGEGFRWFLLGVHYRGPIQFDMATLPDGRVVFPGVDEAERRVDYLYTTLERLLGVGGGEHPPPGKPHPQIARFTEEARRRRDAAEAALADDLNTPVALAELGELARHANELCDLVERRRKDAVLVGAAGPAGRALRDGLRTVAWQLGVLQTPPEEYRARTRARRLALRGLDEGSVQALVDQRRAARQHKDFRRADALRDQLAALGVALSDTPDATLWTVDV